MSGDTQPCAPYIEPFERAKKLFLEQLSEEERLTYENAKPENLFYQASVLHSGYIRSSKLQKCRETLMPLVRAVEKYGELLATPLSSAPVVGTFVSPIWGSLRIVIHFAQAVDEYFEKLIAMLGRIGETLPQYSDYHRLFPNHGRLMLLLSESLASILTFCKKVKDHFNSQETSKKLSDKLLRHKASRKKIELSVPDYLDDFENLKRRIEQEAQLSHMIEDKEHHYRQEEHWALQEGRSRQSRLKEALSTLSKVNYKNQHRQLQSARCAGTGEWLVQEPSFTAWVGGSSSSCFYCFGIPGSGKSVLSSAVVDHLDEEFTSPEDFHGFYFCDYTDLNSLKCSTLLGTLIRQALERSPRPQMLVDWVLKRFDEGDSQPSTFELVDALKRVMGSRKRAVLVLDGIDELDHAEQIHLRRVMQNFMSLEETIVKIFISCRAGVLELDSDPHPAVKLTITPTHVRTDILHYIEQTVESKHHSEELQLGSISLKQDIVQALSAGANEMFLWVTFQIEELCLCYNDEEIRETLKNLPEGLADTYARILHRVMNSKGGSKSIAIACAAFRWVICSARPLLVEELLEALAIKESDSNLHRDRVMTDTRKLIQACGNLITIQLDGTVRPAHHTVQQFLLRDRNIEMEEKLEGPLSGGHELQSPYYMNKYVATNAGSFNFNLLRRIEHVRFFLDEGDRQLGRLCIAYLLFEDFESQIAIREQDRIQMPAEIVNSISSGTLGSSAVVGKVMSKFQGYSRPDTDIGNITLSIPKLDNHDKGKNGDYKLLEYVRSFWPFHLNNLIAHEDNERVAEIAFVREYPFETRPWRTSQFVKSLPKFRGERRSERFHEGRLLFYWALEHKVQTFHLLLMKKKVLPSDTKSEGERNLVTNHQGGLLGAIVVLESVQDTPNQNLVQTAAQWGLDQVFEVFRILRRLEILVVPVQMFYQALVAGPLEGIQVVFDAAKRRDYTHVPDIGFDDWSGNERLLGLGRSTPWCARVWRDVSSVSETPQRIMSAIFVMSFPQRPDVMKYIFSFLDHGRMGHAVGKIIQNAKMDIRKASDDTKRNFIIESLVGTLFPDHGELLSSIRIESGMEKWQDKWDSEVDDARHVASLRQAIEVVRKKEGGESGDENRLKIAQEKIEEVEREKGKQRREDGRTDALIQSLQVELQVIAMKKKHHKRRP
ncbi:uncharacterized protein BKA78DRAFT_37855 [Phyllosticta capitalensis]|uniref:uncharacterized protein n=1 Tax=Phyllosticta capitalensis TaxID=121624 RepID=UPI003131786F